MMPFDRRWSIVLAMINDAYIDQLVEAEIAHSRAVISLAADHEQVNPTIEPDPMSKYIPLIITVVLLLSVVTTAAGIAVTVLA